MSDPITARLTIGVSEAFQRMGRITPDLRPACRTASGTVPMRPHRGSDRERAPTTVDDVTEKLPDIPQAYQPPLHTPVDAHEPPVTPPADAPQPYQVQFPLPYPPPYQQQRGTRSRAGLVIGAVVLALVVLGGLVVMVAQPGPREEAAPAAAAPVAVPEEALPAGEPADTALPELAALPAGAESQPREATNGTATSIRFVNSTAEQVTVNWLDYRQKRVRYTDLAPGQGYEQQTYSGHVWVVTRSDGTTIAVYEATAEASRAVIR